MLFKTAYAICSSGNRGENARQAVRKIRDEFSGFPASFILFFSSWDYASDVIASEMHDAFPGVITLGCTSSGEGIDDKILSGSVVAMAFSHEVFGYGEIALILKDKAEALKAKQADIFYDTREAVTYLARNLGSKLSEIDYREYIGFMLSDNITDFSESVIEHFGDMSNIFLFGGIAGDDYKFDGSCRVMYQGKAYSDAAVISLWKPKDGFALIKTQAVETTTQTAVVTRADEQRNIVWELDGEDATVVYSRLMGVPVESMDILDFDEYPWASTVHGEPFLRAVLEKVDGKGLRFTARVRQGTRLNLTKAGDIYQTTKKALDEKRAEIGDLSAIIHINCASRHTALKKWGRVDDFAKLFGDVPSISVSSYGEIYVGMLAMTSSILLLK